jgi:hypothetical protein
MLDQSRTSNERDHHTRCALTARTERLAAQSVNDLLTGKEATALAIVLTALPVEAAQIVEVIFEARGWPADDVDEAYLDGAGRVVWAAYQTYRAEAAA